MGNCGLVAIPAGLGMTEEHLSYAQRLDRPRLAGIQMREFNQPGRDALLTLATFRGRGGLICPAHATVAARTSLCAKTVERALHAARELGLVTWSERRVRRGWRWLRTSNAYQLLVPHAAVEPGLRRPCRSNRPPVGRGESKQERRLMREALVALPWAVVKASQEALAARCQAVQAALQKGRTNNG
jgi:hypothetical protein